MMLKKLGLSLGIALNLILPVSALPGQNLKTAIQWARNHPLIQNLSNHDYPYSCKDFKGKYIQTYRGNYLRYFVYVHADNHFSLTDIIFEKIYFYQEDKIKLLTDIYGWKIAEDFQNSKYVANIYTYGEHYKFYRGKRFAYIVEGVKFNFLYLLRLEDFNDAVNNIRRVGGVYICSDAE